MRPTRRTAPSPSRKRADPALLLTVTSLIQQAMLAVAPALIVVPVWRDLNPVQRVRSLEQVARENAVERCVHETFVGSARTLPQALWTRLWPQA